MSFFDEIAKFDPIIGAANQPKYGSMASQANKQAQAQIDRGMAAINAVFGGGSYPIYTAATGTFDPAASYLTLDKSGQYTPYTGKSLGKSQKKLTKGQLYTMSTSPTYSGFSPDFYNQYGQSYINYAMPQVADQFSQAYRTSMESLANRGLLRSSAQRQTTNRLAATLGGQERQVVDTAHAQSNQLKAAVEAAKQNAINQLYTTADPSNAALSAINTATVLQQPSVFAPITNAFTDVLNQYYTNRLMQMYSTPNVTYSPGASTDFLPENY